MTRTQAAWCAGLFDGEGSIGVYSGHLQVRINMTCRKTIMRFWCLVRMGKIRKVHPKQPRRKDYWSYRANGEQGRAVLRLMLPYLITKEARARHVVAR